MEYPVEYINQMEPWIGEEERQALISYLDEGAWLTEFKKTRQFEQMIADYVGSKYAIVVANGTVSLTMAMLALDIGAGDEVLVPDFTMLASATSVVLCGATPVFVDVTLDNWCIDLELAEKHITPHTKAMMLVSINGRCPDMEKAQEICQRNNIHLIEDAAQSLGSRYKDKHLGTWGEIGSFSFSAPKVITTGQGGALVTDDPLLDARMRKVKDFGRRQPGEDYYESVGYNFKFTDLQAVVGIEQMKKLPWRVERKKEMLKLYQAQLEDVWAVSFPTTDTKEVCPWFIDIIVPDPNALKIYLESRGVGSRLVYPALHSQPAFNLPGSYPVAEYIAKYGLWLPSSSFLSDKDIYRVCSYIRYYYETMRW